MSLSITCDSLTGGNIAGVVSRNSHELAFHSKATTVTLDTIAYTGSPTDHDDVRINAAICSSKATAKAAADAFQFSIVKTAADNCRVYVYVKEDSAAAEPSAGTTLWDSGALGYLVTDVVIHIDPQQFLIVVSGALAANIDKKSGVHGLAQSDWGIGYHLSLEGQHTHNGTDHNDIGFTLDRTLIRDIQFFDVFDATIPVADSGVYTDYNTVFEDDTTTAITKSSNQLVLVADGPATDNSDVAICSKVSPIFNGVAMPMSYEADLAWTTNADDAAASKFVFFLTPDGQVPDDVYIKVELGHDKTYKITERGNNAAETVIVTGSSVDEPTKFKLTTDCTVFDGTYTAIMKYTLTVNDLAAGGTNNGTNKFPYRFRTDTQNYPAQGNCGYGFQVQRNESTTKSVTVKVSNFIISRECADTIGSASDAIDNDIHTAPVVWGSITDGIQLNHPELPTAQTRAVDGIIDGSLAPFYADKTGTADSTAAINHAIEFCIENQMVLFLPAGDYTVSDTLRGRSRRRFRSSGTTENIQRWGSCVITGSTEGETNIQLANSSPGFNNTAAAARKPILETLSLNESTFWKTDLNDHMSCVISNLTITNGTGNAGAIGIRSQGAQGCVIRNCTIDFTNIGETCLDGGNGSGGYNYNITFKGGNIQADYQDSYYSAQDLVNDRDDAGGAQPVPGLYGCTFINPVSKSIKYRAFGPLLVLGCHFQSNTTGKTFINNAGATGGWSLARGMLILIDCVAEFNSYHVDNIVIDTDRSLYIRNLSVEHASVSSGIVKFAAAKQAAAAINTAPQTINGNTGGNWKVLHEYAQGIHPPVSSSKTFASTSATFQYYHNVYTDGSKSDSPILGAENSTVDASAVDTAAINVLKAKHLPDSIVSFETSGILNTRDYGVKGDGETDDTAAIETALAAAAAADKFLFFPKGYYKITDKITLPKNAKIIGVHRDFTTIWPMGGEFGDGGSSGSIFGVESNADADGTLHIQDMAFNSSSQYNNLAGGLHIRSPETNIVETSHRTQSEYGYGGSPFTPGGTADPLEIDLVKLSGNAGGKIFGIDQGGNWLRSRHCRYFKAENTTNELWIYTLNVEHSKSDAMIEFNNCRNFHVCGVKSESMYTVARYEDCTDFEHLGAGGTFSPAYPELWVDNEDDKGWFEVDNNTANTHASIVSNAQFEWDEKPTYARFVDCDDYRIVCLQDSADSIYNSTWVSNYGWYFVPGRDSSNTYYNNTTHDTRWLTSAGWPTISQLKNHVIHETITDVCDDSPVADMERPIVWQRGTPPT